MDFPLRERVPENASVSTINRRFRDGLDPETLDYAAALATLRGNYEHGQKLYAAAERKRDEARWAWELDAVARWVPAEPVPELVEAARRRRPMSKKCVQGKPPTHYLDTTTAEPVVDPPSRKCGVRRFGRTGAGETVIYHVPCSRRGCVECRPVVVAAKVAAVPEHAELYAVEVPRSAWAALDKRLRRRRDADEPGEYVRIPRADGMLLVVSDSPIGRPIERAQVEAVMLRASTADGHVTASRSWRVEPTAAPEGFTDEGIVTSRVEWVVEVAERRLSLQPRVDHRSGQIRFGVLPDEKHAELRVVAQVMSDPDYHQLVREHISADRPVSGRHLARMHQARKVA